MALFNRYNFGTEDEKTSPLSASTVSRRKLAKIQKRLAPHAREQINDFMRLNDYEKVTSFSKFLKDNKVNISPFNLKFKDYKKYLKVAGSQFLKYPRSYFNTISEAQMKKGFN